MGLRENFLERKTHNFDLGGGVTYVRMERVHKVLNRGKYFSERFWCLCGL
jgi:hypothetical protein